MLLLHFFEMLIIANKQDSSDIFQEKAEMNYYVYREGELQKDRVMGLQTLRVRGKVCDFQRGVATEISRDDLIGHGWSKEMNSLWGLANHRLHHECVLKVTDSVTVLRIALADTAA